MSQTYPIGRDNLNQLIQLQLGTEAFDIIHKVADNLDLIKKVSEALNSGDSSPTIQIQILNEKLNIIDVQLQIIHNNIYECTMRKNAIQPSP